MTRRLNLECLRCGHKWVARRKRKKKDIRQCPKCKSAWWDTPRPNESAFVQTEEPALKAIVSEDPLPIPDKPPEAPPAVKPAISIIDSSGRLYPVWQWQIDEWSFRYPEVDVMYQLQMIKSISASKPAKRKDAKELLRFIESKLEQRAEVLKGGVL